jgi:hypothetical protein
MTDYNTRYFADEMDRNIAIENAARRLREAQEALAGDIDNPEFERDLAEAAQEMDAALNRKPSDVQ